MDLWEKLKEHTQARIGLHRTGHSLSTPELLMFQLAHAEAMDAVNEVWDISRMAKMLKTIDEKPIKVHTAVSARELYLKYPNLGKILQEKDRLKLEKIKSYRHTDIAIIVSDGLSPRAVDHHFIPFWKIFKPLLKKRFKNLKITLLIAPFGRVALSDPIGEYLGANLSLIFIGERPGLSNVDSLGVYLTYNPKIGNSDEGRNCISNIHPPEGLSYPIAGEKLLYLITEALKQKISGVTLKDESSSLLIQKRTQ